MAKRGTVFAILNTSIPIGVFTGFMVGGWVSQLFGWRAAFLVVGLPGVILALLIRFTLREPPRGYSEPQSHVSMEPSALKDTLTYLWSLKSYRHIVLATSIMTLGAYGSGIWIPSFFIRSHGMSPAEIGTWLAFVYGIGGGIGTTLGGMISDRRAKKSGDARWYMWVPAVAGLGIMPFSFFVYLWPDPIQALLVQVCTAILMHMFLGPAYGTVQSLAGVKRRAMAAAINLFLINLIALGLGPLIIGMASDFFNAQFGDNALRYAILTLVVVAYNWAAVHFFLAAKTLRQDLVTAEG